MRTGRHDLQIVQPCYAHDVTYLTISRRSINIFFCLLVVGQALSTYANRGRIKYPAWEKSADFEEVVSECWHHCIGCRGTKGRQGRASGISQQENRSVIGHGHSQFRRVILRILRESVYSFTKFLHLAVTPTIMAVQHSQSESYFVKHAYYWNAGIRWSKQLPQYSVINFNLILFITTLSRDSAVGIATGYGLDDRGVGVRVSVWSRIFSTPSTPTLGLTRPPTQGAPGALSSGVKRPGHEADHSPTTSAKVKKMWIYTSTSPYAFMAYCLIS
jgi:hypothetical protein